MIHMSILIMVAGVILFIALIIVHELGHFMVARRNGVVAEEFGIFFPPHLYQRQTKKGWLFSINLLPLGGYVKLKGEHDADLGKGSYGSASTWAKTKIMAAGVFMNLIAGVFLLMILAWIGMPQLIPNQYDVNGGSHISKSDVLVTSVQKGSPAAAAGLVAEDQVLSIGKDGKTQPVNSVTDLQRLTKEYAGQTVQVVYKYNGSQYSKEVKLLPNQVVQASLKTNNPKGYLGITLATLQLKQFSWWGGPVEAVGLTWQVIRLTFIGLGHALAGLGQIIAGLVTGNTTARQHGQAAASSQVAGPVGIFFILKDSSLLGYQYMLFIVAIISLTLAIMNFLPIPALDGGRLWLTLVSRGFGRKLSSSFEEMVNAIGMLILFGLIILITLVDVHRFF